MRSLWKGAITFGMVAIPAKLFGATEERKVSFHQVHAECSSRIQMPRWCPVCDRKVESDELVKGFEYAKGQMVTLSEADFETLPLKSLKAVEIVEFTRPEVIDPRQVKSSYFLAPEEVGGRAFNLLKQAMEVSGLVAIAKLAMREREHLSVMRPFGRVLLLQTLYWADELRSASELETAIPEAQPSEREVALASALVEKLIGDGNLAQYQDEYREALQRLVEAKLAGEVLEAPAVPVARDKDLVEELMASLGVKA